MYMLSPSLLVGKGLHRECYVHPEDPNRCIKVVVSGSAAETRREQAYYRFLEKRKISWELLPRFYGNVDTHLGRGAVFDLIRDQNGEISKPLTHYLDHADIANLYAEQLNQALWELKHYLVREKIITMTLKAKNMVYCKTSDTGGRIIIVDNIGNSDFIPIANYLDWAAKIKIRRRFRRFESRLWTKYHFNTVR